MDTSPWPSPMRPAAPTDVSIDDIDQFFSLAASEDNPPSFLVPHEHVVPGFTNQVATKENHAGFASSTSESPRKCNAQTTQYQPFQPIYLNVEASSAPSTDEFIAQLMIGRKENLAAADAPPRPYIHSAGNQFARPNFTSSFALNNELTLLGWFPSPGDEADFSFLQDLPSSTHKARPPAPLSPSPCPEAVSDPPENEDSPFEMKESAPPPPPSPTELFFQCEEIDADFFRLPKSRQDAEFDDDAGAAYPLAYPEGPYPDMDSTGLDLEKPSPSDLFFSPNAPSYRSGDSASCSSSDSTSTPPGTTSSSSLSSTAISRLPAGTKQFYRHPDVSRLRSNAACEACRARKQKCSGIRPTCKHCMRRGKVCVWKDLAEPKPAPSADQVKAKEKRKRSSKGDRVSAKRRRILILQDENARVEEVDVQDAHSAQQEEEEACGSEGATQPETPTPETQPIEDLTLCELDYPSPPPPMEGTDTEEPNCESTISTNDDTPAEEESAERSIAVRPLPIRSKLTSRLNRYDFPLTPIRYRAPPRPAWRAVVGDGNISGAVLPSESSDSTPTSAPATSPVALSPADDDAAAVSGAEPGITHRLGLELSDGFKRLRRELEGVGRDGLTLEDHLSRLLPASHSDSNETEAASDDSPPTTATQSPSERVGVPVSTPISLGTNPDHLPHDVQREAAHSIQLHMLSTVVSAQYSSPLGRSTSSSSPGALLNIGGLTITGSPDSPMERFRSNRLGAVDTTMLSALSALNNEIENFVPAAVDEEDSYASSPQDNAEIASGLPVGSPGRAETPTPNDLEAHFFSSATFTQFLSSSQTTSVSRLTPPLASPNTSFAFGYQSVGGPYSMDGQLPPDSFDIFNPDFTVDHWDLPGHEFDDTDMLMDESAYVAESSWLSSIADNLDSIGDVIMF